jgi:DNA primase
MAADNYPEIYKEVIETVDIVETIQKYIKLELKGSYYEGKCPFDPNCGDSFCVSSKHKTFMCFGCFSKGNVVAFMAKIGNMCPKTAARFLSNLQKTSAWDSPLVGDPQVGASENHETLI